MIKTFLAASALVLTVGAASAATIVANGDFEEVDGIDFTIGGGNWGIGSLPGWYNTTGGIEVQKQDAIGLTPNTGSHFVEMDGNSNYTIYQNVNLTAGRYLLSFAYSPRVADVDCVDPCTNTNGIGFAVGSLLGGSVSGPGGPDGTSVGAWTVFEKEFTVTTAGLYELSFFGQGTDESLGGMLDTVAISAVPVPAAGLLLLGALGGMAALRRRRKNV